MVVQEASAVQQNNVLAQQVFADARVQHEFAELNNLLEQIAESPAPRTPQVEDATWRIDDPDVHRWLITLEGRVNLERIARFRQSLLREDEVIDAQVVAIENGEIRIRVITTGGLPMGPLELAVGKLTARNES